MYFERGQDSSGRAASDLLSIASHAVLCQLCEKIRAPSIYSINYNIVTGLSSQFLHILHLLGQTVHCVSRPDVGGAVGGGGRRDALLAPPAQAGKFQRLFDLLQLYNSETRVVYYLYYLICVVYLSLLSPSVSNSNMSSFSVTSILKYTIIVYLSSVSSNSTW